MAFQGHVHAGKNDRNQSKYEREWKLFIKIKVKTKTNTYKIKEKYLLTHKINFAKHDYNV